MANVLATRTLSAPRFSLEELKCKISSLLDTKRVEKAEQPIYRVIHPLDDLPEEKVNVKSLGMMKMTPSVKFSLYLVRGYLLCMMGLVLYHVLNLAGVV